ncbi:MAG: methyltransferase domain-containing protein [Sphingobacteriaceae bacterium]
MPDFSRRSTDQELMDDFNLDQSRMDIILDELDKVNALLGGYQVFYDAIKKLNIGPETHISDWGCGGGDSLRKIASWAAKRKLPLRLTGVDATRSAVEYARQHSLDYPNIDYLEADVFSESVSENEFDVVISSLFTHHFENARWIKLIQKMHGAARKAVIINDLHRHWFAYYSIKWIMAGFSKSEIVQHDAPLSVLRSFTKKELITLLSRAGIASYQIRWMWAFRWQIIIYK